MCHDIGVFESVHWGNGRCLYLGRNALTFMIQRWEKKTLGRIILEGSVREPSCFCASFMVFSCFCFKTKNTLLYMLSSPKYVVV